MHACRVGGQRERAITFLEEMIRKEMPVDTDSFSIIIAACDEPKLSHRALEVSSSSSSGGGDGSSSSSSSSKRRKSCLKVGRETVDW